MPNDIQAQIDALVQQMVAASPAKRASMNSQLTELKRQLAEQNALATAAAGGQQVAVPAQTPATPAPAPPAQAAAAPTQEPKPASPVGKAAQTLQQVAEDVKQLPVNSPANQQILAAAANDPSNASVEVLDPQSQAGMAANAQGVEQRMMQMGQTQGPIDLEAAVSGSVYAGSRVPPARVPAGPAPQPVQHPEMGQGASLDERMDPGYTMGTDQGLLGKVTSPRKPVELGERGIAIRDFNQIKENKGLGEALLTVMQPKRLTGAYGDIGPVYGGPTSVGKGVLEKTMQEKAGAGVESVPFVGEQTVGPVPENVKQLENAPSAEIIPGHIPDIPNPRFMEYNEAPLMQATQEQTDAAVTPPDVSMMDKVRAGVAHPDTLINAAKGVSGKVGQWVNDPQNMNTLAYALGQGAAAMAPGSGIAQLGQVGAGLAQNRAENYILQELAKGTPLNEINFGVATPEQQQRAVQTQYADDMTEAELVGKRQSAMTSGAQADLYRAQTEGTLTNQQKMELGRLQNMGDIDAEAWRAYNSLHAKTYKELAEQHDYEGIVNGPNGEITYKFKNPAKFQQAFNAAMRERLAKHGLDERFLSMYTPPEGM